MSKMLSTSQNLQLRKGIQSEIEIQKRISARLCEDSLHHFTRTFWPLIEPSNPFVDGWHIQEICRHLEAQTEFKIKQLLIAVPPRHMKSILCSIMWPAWVWIKRPERRFLSVSYSQSLSIGHAVKMRQIVESQLYQDMFKPEWELRDDQNLKTKFENTKTGFRFSTSVGGTVTGEGADHILIDDPINAADSKSTPIRETANDFVKSVLATRMNNPEKYSKTLIMQRLHEEDPAGEAMKEGKKNPIADYERLIFPAKFDPEISKQCKSSIGFQDPRTEVGQLLWPERFSPTTIAKLENDLGEDAHAQLQQDPKPSSGGTFKREWWKFYEAPPTDVVEIVQFWDCAEKPGITNDYSVCATWARTHSGFYLLDLWRDKADMPTLEEQAKAQYHLWRPNAVVIEDKSGGASVIQYLLRETTIPVLPYNPGRKDKQVRAMSATPSAKAGKIHLPLYAKYTEDFVKEHEKFPRAANDDQVDTTSMMVAYFNGMETIEPRVRTL